MLNLQPASFAWDDSPAFAGFHVPGSTWNGFAVPYFEHDVAMRIAAASDALAFDEALGVFVDEDSGPCPVFTRGDGVRLHQIAPGWAWQVVAEAEA
jgi:hypothetical protein